MNILITGAAGYIGSHVAKELLEKSTHTIFVLDNLSTGHLSTIETLQKIRTFTFEKLDLKAFDKVDAFLGQHNIEVILHFSASSVVSESVMNPLKYYMNNTVNTTNLIHCAIKHGVKKFIFSSTAAVYGEPTLMDEKGILEEDETVPINPYGMSKLMSENVLKSAARAHKDFKYVIFRYFNVAGCDMHFLNKTLDPRIGEWHEPETHIIPLVAKTALGRQSCVKLFGEDYDTPDGSCIRDYIHVDDLSYAHIKAIDFLNENESNTFNLGYGKGYSVKEIIDTFKGLTQSDFNVMVTQRREGDPSVLIANNSKLVNEYVDVFKWQPKYNDIELICQSVLMWEKKQRVE